MKPNWAGTWDTFEDWVIRATRDIGRNLPTDTIGMDIRAICIDAKGRRCQCGGDFMRARDDGSFPVRFFWDFKP